MNDEEMLALAVLLDMAIANAETLPYRALEPLAQKAQTLGMTLWGELEDRDNTGRDLD
ncbi:hypothetical protein D9M68_563000 [compost metagenome]